MSRPGRPTGYAVITGEKTVEIATFTCCHCNSVVHVDPEGSGVSAEMFARAAVAVNPLRCPMCQENQCLACAAKMRCEPFEKKLLAAEARDRLRAAAAEWG